MPASGLKTLSNEMNNAQNKEIKIVCFRNFLKKMIFNFLNSKINCIKGKIKTSDEIF